MANPLIRRISGLNSRKSLMDLWRESLRDKDPSPQSPTTGTPTGGQPAALQDLAKQFHADPDDLGAKIGNLNGLEKGSPAKNAALSDLVMSLLGGANQGGNQGGNQGATPAPTPAVSFTPAPAPMPNPSSTPGENSGSGSSGGTPAVTPTPTPGTQPTGAPPSATVTPIPSVSPAGGEDVSPGAVSTFAPYDMNGPNLPAEQVKARINGAIDRNWDQVRSSFGFSNDAAGKNDAYSFFQGVASRESGTGGPDGTMKTNLVTGEGSSLSRGPLQTADTAYANNGHPDWVKDSHVPGIPQADLSRSNDLDTSIAMGIRHMCEGAERGKAAGHSGTEAAKLDAMAYHNTGWINAAGEASWRSSYAAPILQMAGFYGKHTSDSSVTYTGDKSLGDQADLLS